MPRRMPTEAQLLRDLPDSQPQPRGQAVEQAALADAGVAGEDGNFAMEARRQLLQPLASLRTDLHGADAGGLVALEQFFRWV